MKEQTMKKLITLIMTFLLCLGSVAPTFAADKKKGFEAYMVYKAVDQGDLKWNTKVDISDYPFELTVSAGVSNIPLDARKYTVKQLLDATLICQ